jgi:hypothetical protein
MSEPEHRAHCLCGAVALKARGAPSWVGLCHCQSCRRASGGVLIAAAGFSRNSVAIARGRVSYYASSPGVRRGFCANCGTALSYENERWPADIHLMIGAFEHPERLTPQFRIFTEEQIPWLKLADGLPRYRTTPGAGELMDLA